MYENESGYGSDFSNGEEKSAKNFCKFCKKCISGPRIGFVVHLGRKHLEKSIVEISKEVKGSEMRQITLIRKRAIDTILHAS